MLGYFDSRIALVSMPFVTVGPSIQLALLKAIAVSAGFEVDTFHLYLDFAKRIGLQGYEALAEHRGVLVGEWLFSKAAFGTSCPDSSDLFLSHFQNALDPVVRQAGQNSEWLLHLRNREIPGFLDDLIGGIDWKKYGLVGFTSTFQQNVASFALTKRLKAEHPDLVIVFGGANFDGEMGSAWMESMPYIDFAIAGEADRAFPELLKALGAGTDPSLIPGVISRSQKPATSPHSIVTSSELNNSPFNDYDDYFSRLAKLGVMPAESNATIAIPFQTSRGCWWGQKHHCTFCGLNGSSMSFRSKSPERVLEELRHYRDRYGSNCFQAVDDIIDHAYFRTLLPLLSQSVPKYRIFYEVKANLSREQIKLLHEAGVEWIQPGIESLNTDVLKSMQKGITAIQNVNTLRWALHYDINVSWNLLYGFHSDTEERYITQSALVPHLLHLQPPTSTTRVRMERFSPLFADPRTNGVVWARPESSYHYVYPSNVDLARTAYFFDYGLETSVSNGIYDDTLNSIAVWQEAWRSASRPRFVFTGSSEELRLTDHREFQRPVENVLTGVDAAIYMACVDRPCSLRTIETQANARPAYIEPILSQFCESGWMMREGDQFLSLAIPVKF